MIQIRRNGHGLVHIFLIHEPDEGRYDLLLGRSRFSSVVKRVPALLDARVDWWDCKQAEAEE